MKTTDFLRENAVIAQESPEDISMVVNNLHTIMRVTADLANRLKGNEDLDEWVKEKIAVAKAMMTTVEDYVASQQEMGGEEESLPSFDVDNAERAMAEMIDDDGNPLHEMDSQPPQGRIKSDGTRSHSTYGSRDGHSITGPDLTAKATTPKKVIKKGTDILDRAFKDAEQGKRTVKENATGGATGASSVAVSMGGLGEQGGFSKKDLNKKLGSYGNRLSNVKKVK